MFLWVMDYNINGGLRTLINTNYIVAAQEKQIGVPRQGRNLEWDYYAGWNIKLTTGDTVHVGAEDWNEIEAALRIGQSTEPTSFEFLTEEEFEVEVPQPKRTPPKKSAKKPKKASKSKSVKKDDSVPQTPEDAGVII